jgi:hypothetical protein
LFLIHDELYFIAMRSITEEPAWASEIRKRVREVEDGEVDLIDHEVVMREARENLAQGGVVSPAK